MARTDGAVKFLPIRMLAWTVEIRSGKWLSPAEFGSAVAENSKRSPGSGRRSGC